MCKELITVAQKLHRFNVVLFVCIELSKAELCCICVGCLPCAKSNLNPLVTYFLKVVGS